MPSSFNRRPPAGQRPARTPPIIDEKSLYDYSVGALGRRMRTVSQMRSLLRRRLAKQEDGAPLIEAVLTRLKQHGYLSDANFSASYSSMRKQNQGFGQRRVAQDLLQKGVNSEVVAREVAAVYAETDEETLARAFLARKRIGKPADQRAAARLFRVLGRAGFSGSIAVRILRNWDVEVDAAIEAED